MASPAIKAKPSTAAPHDGNQYGRCKVTSFATCVAPTKARSCVAFAFAVVFVGAAGAAKPATRDPRLLPQSRQSQPRNTTRWRSIWPLQARQLRDCRRSYKSEELPLPLALPLPLLLWERRKSRSRQHMIHGFSAIKAKASPATPNDGAQYDLWKVTSLATPVAPTKARSCVAFAVAVDVSHTNRTKPQAITWNPPSA